MPDIPINIEDSLSSDEEVIKTKLIKLTQTNWVQWSCQVENYFISKGIDDLFIEASDETKKNSKFRKKNSSAIAMLWSSISPEFKGILLNNKTSFFDFWEALGSACGKNSIIKLSQTLHKLINLCYDPGSSLETHIDEFQKLHANYQSLTTSTTTSMQLSSDMAAVFFFHSLENDKELSNLCQTLYEIKPFNLNSITDCVAVEHPRRQSDSTIILMADKSKQKDNNKNYNQNENSNNNWKSNQGKDKKNNRFQNKNQSSNNQDSIKRLENLERMMSKIHATLKISSINIAEESQETVVQQSDSDAFICKYINSVGKKKNKGFIYLDSGAGQKVVNDLSLLTNPVKVKKHINTFSSPVQVTHEGSMNFKGVSLHPVFYVPNGPVNLLSVSQLCDHGLKVSTKSNMMLVKQHDKIIATFHRDGNLFLMKKPTLKNQSIYSVVMTNQDWHISLGHPSNSYLAELLRTGKIKGPFTKSNTCNICKQAKIKSHPHAQKLPSVDTPFFKLHMDTLQISPASQKGHNYILVIIDDYSRFNRIFPMIKKDEAEKNLDFYLNEIKNKLNISPAFLHSDRGGEFCSTLFSGKLKTLGICIEQGPPNSPETNGVAEHFNQSLLSKMRCPFSQSNIPIGYWDEAAHHTSLLLNHLPHKFLKMQSPTDVLISHNASLEPRIPLNRFIPFGMKVIVKTVNNQSKIQDQGESLRALTFEKYSDGLRVLDLNNGRIRISRDYSISANAVTATVRQPENVLPKAVELKIKLKLPNSHLTTQGSSEKEPPCTSITQHQELEESPSRDKNSAIDKHFEYVPFYDKPEKNISSNICSKNIVEGKRNRKQTEKLLLTDVVPYSQAMNNKNEQDQWKEAMDLEFNSLMSHDTGTLVPYPRDGEKVIGGMWCLTRKKNEFGKVYRYKARWVVFGNHQEHLLHYFDTWASVGRNETFKVMLLLVINLDLCAYQFDVETAFLHGSMDAVIYVKQVKGYEQWGKEDWVWRLNKSLYGTRQTPRMWKEKLTDFLNTFGFQSSNSDESLFITKEAQLMLHIHVDDGFLIGKSETEILFFLNNLNTKSKIKYKKKPTQHLGYNLTWEFQKIKINQTDLIKKLLIQNDMEECKPVRIPCSININLEYTKSNLSNQFSQLTGWADADYANARDSRRSVSGNVILFFNNPISWLSKQQSVVSQSTTEAEYISMNICAKQLQWLTYILTDLHLSITKPTLFNDNSGAIIISKQASLNENTKHIQVRYQYIRDCVMKKLLNVIEVGSDKMIADILTKPLGVQKVNTACNQLHLVDPGGVSDIRINADKTIS
ncbi:hypothetical protein O181_004714 [Austropuccinia psidii MF-1]|uniref:Integrase catalytic domain-containing protein n=1 Tax=Austropuccinia psidii MF-1 TaxID=1389203 RepID=A0A9Q3BGB1_9BASI|nr:hypothetical protein [Austropuccinia psidii MF-1]